MKQELKKYDWIDAVRGYAILLVIMIHTSLLFVGNESFHLERLTKIGDLGVTLFFIASSFTLFNSYEKRSIVDAQNTRLFFYIRRFFRIAPLYYVAGAFYIMLAHFFHTMWLSAPIEPLKVFSCFTFTNGLYLPAISYVPPGSWSIGVEMLFYLILPFLYSKIDNIKKAFWVFIFSVICSFLLQTILWFIIENFTSYAWGSLRTYELYLWFPNQFPVFCSGILLFFIVRKKMIYKEWILIFSIFLIITLSLFDYNVEFPYFFIQREYLYSVAFIIFAFSLSNTSFKFMIKPINKLGKVSFCAYLFHFFRY